MPLDLEIRLDDPKSTEVAELVNGHLAAMARHSPPESAHALGVEGLSAPEVTLWTVREGSILVGCGALKELDRQHGEVKSMHTVSTYLRRGVATMLLEHMLGVARDRGYSRLSLETGSMAAYAPARALYAHFGFEVCDPFGSYTEDPNSVFMTRML